MNNLFFSYSIVSSLLFFSIMSMFGVKVTDESGLSPFHSVSAFLAVICFFIFVYQYFAKKINAKYLAPSFFLIVFMIVAGIGSGNVINNSYLLQFIVLCIPSALAGVYYSNYDNAIRIVKWLDIYMIILSISLIIFLPKFYLSMLSADVYYSQTISYNAAFSFLLNLFLFNTRNYENRFMFVQYKVYRYFSLCLLPIMLFIIIFSGGRGGLITLIAGVLCFILLTNTNIKRILKWTILSILIFYVGGMILSDQASSDLLSFLERSSSRLFSYFDDTKDDVAATSGRNIIWAKSMSLISDRPLLGYGIFDYIKYLGTYPHNIFVEWLLQGGIILFTIASFLWIKLIHKGFKLFKKEKSLLAIMPLIIYPFTQLLFSGRWVSQPFFWFSICFILNYSLFQTSKQTNKR